MICHFELHNFEEKGKKQTHALKIALLIAVIFMAVEFLFGYLANSLALIADALHMFTDVGAFLLSIVAIKIGMRPKTSKMSFGYRRAEILGALASSVILWALCLIIIYEAITRMIHPEEVKGLIVFIVATIGLIANIVMMKVLHTHQEGNLNVKAAFLHVIGDLLGSIGVIASGLIILWTHYSIVDPIISTLFALIILFTSAKIIKKTTTILMEGAPQDINPDEVEKNLLKLPGVRAVFDLHIWTVAEGQNALSCHLRADEISATLKRAHAMLKEKYNIYHATLEVDLLETIE
ncbi:MAG: cation diffusion facilitator family transporter [Candidatus Algichlamydia australiensis]|nr:cation diffusion facilitator family transporter [Chlamydiales bacterium]